MKEMNIYIISSKILTLAFALITINLSGQTIKKMTEANKFIGPVKYVSTYQFQPKNFDTLGVDPNIEVNAYLIEERYYDESSGLLTKKVRHNHRDEHTIITNIDYDQKKNATSKVKYYSKDNRSDTITIDYNYEDKTIISNSTSNALNYIDGKPTKINYNISYFDDRNIVTKIETMGEENELLRYHIRVIDSLERLSVDSIYEYISFKQTTSYKYDSLNRKTRVEIKDSNGDVTALFNYSYYDDNHTEMFRYDEFGELKDRSKGKIYYDDVGNEIKRYTFRFGTKQTFIIENKIEYF